MSYFKIALGLAVAGALSACSVSAEHSEVSAAEHSHGVDVASKAHSHIATVKPGASVTMTRALPKVMTSGSFQAVQLQFSEAYNSGTMSVSIEPSAGLRLFGGSSSKTFDMTSSGAHIWDLDVKADVDGVYFLNVFAEAGGQARVFSVQMNIGQVTQKMFDEAMPADGELIDGGKIRVLEATETIK